MQKYGIIAEVVSAAAIVISLIFVGFEIRQSANQTERNTVARQVSTYQELIARITELNTIKIDNKELSAAIAKVESQDSVDLSDWEYQMVYRHSWILFRYGDIAYYQYQSGLLSEDRLKSALAPVVFLFQFPWYRERWKGARINFVVEYRSFIDRIIEEKAYRVNQIKVRNDYR